MKKALLFLCLASTLVLGISCFYPGDWAAGWIERKPSQQPDYLGYLEQVKAQQLNFLIPAFGDSEAWPRAKYILKKLRGELTGNRKLRVSTADILEIAPSKYDVHYYDEGFLYRIARAPRGDMTRYEVSYSSPSHGIPQGEEYMTSLTRARARIVAYYIVSGRLYEEAFHDNRLR